MPISAEKKRPGSGGGSAGKKFAAAACTAPTFELASSGDDSPGGILAHVDHELLSSGDDMLLSPCARFTSAGVSAAVPAPVSQPFPVRVLPVPASPLSPGNNRNRFMANSQPLQVSCDLSSVGLHNNSMRFSFSAVVLIVYPQSDKPERRHIQMIDCRGSTGLTVWGPTVGLFSSSSVGKVVKFSKLSMIMFNGKKGLSMCRDTTISFPSALGVATEEAKWWADLLVKTPKRIIDIHDLNDDGVISVSGIVGSLSTELKRVRNEDKELLCIRLTDRTGFVDMRSWTHSEAEFSEFLERPLLFRRVRVTSFGGLKILELLEGSGTEVVADFDGANDLTLYWQE
jgi:hypothetical protein